MQKLLLVLLLSAASTSNAADLTPGWYFLKRNPASIHNDHLDHTVKIRELVKPLYKGKRLVSVKVWKDEYIENGNDSWDKKRRFDCKSETCHMKFPQDWRSYIEITGQKNYKYIAPLANPDLEENWNYYELDEPLSHEDIDARVKKADDDGF